RRTGAAAPFYPYFFLIASDESRPARLGLGQRHALLSLIFPAAILIRDLADLVRFQEQHLRHTLVGVNLRRERRRVRELERDVAFPFRLERRHVHDDAAARIRGLAQADRQDVPRDSEILDRARQGERVGRNDADVRFDVDEAAGIEVLRVDDRRVDVREDLELVRATHVVAVARRAVRNDLAVRTRTHLPRLEGFDHSLLCHSANPAVGFDAHEYSWKQQLALAVRGSLEGAFAHYFLLQA